VDARVSWQKNLSFLGTADSGYPVLMNGQSASDTGAGPLELTLMSLAGCTAMDVISILNRKNERVREFEVRAHADRATDYPRVITRAELEYVVAGHGIREASLVRAIELSVKRYCPVHAMLEKAFPIELKYCIYEAMGANDKKLSAQGRLTGSSADSGCG
jgi:putative redox protein